MKKYYSNIDDLIEELAIAYYTNDSTSNINSILRGSRVIHHNETNVSFGIGFRELDAYIYELSELTIAKQLDEDTILYRGLRETPKIIEYIDNKCFPEKGFCSTSFDKNTAIMHSYTIKDNIKTKGWIMQIYAPKNTSGAFLEQHPIIPSEMEFLMPQNLKFHLFDVNYEKKRI